MPFEPYDTTLLDNDMLDEVILSSPAPSSTWSNPWFKIYMDLANAESVAEFVIQPVARREVRTRDLQRASDIRILTTLLERISQHGAWRRGASFGRGYTHCLMEWLNLCVRDAYDDNQRVGQVCHMLNRYLLPASGCGSALDLIHFNDHPRTKQRDVVRVVEIALELANAD